MKIPNLVIRPFIPGDFAMVTNTAWAGDAFGPAMTAVIDGEIAGCAGLVLSSYAPVARAWVAIGPVGREHRTFIARGVLRGLRTFIDQYKLVRVEADTIVNDTNARRWLEWMGFEDEGVMRKKGPNGEDMIRYALFPKGPR